MAAAFVLAAPVALAPVAEAAPVRGAAGIGDAYFPLDGNGGIDVLHYRIHDTYRFADRHLRGRTRLTVRATEDLKSFHLDFLLPVHRVSVDGEHAVYDQATRRHELVVVPKKPVRAGETFEVVVAYAGFPGRYGYRGERNWLADAHEVVAMNQPHMAPWWFPANDHPRDKALVDISITVPRGRQVIANGRRVAHHVDGNQATYHWRADEPMVPYLAFFAAGRFRVSQGVRDGLPWLVAVSRGLPASQQRTSMRLMEKTPGAVAWLATQLGDYPFSQTGGLTTSLSPGFALENQTRPTYPVLGSSGTGIRRARAGAPVVRRLGRGRELARHLAQRGLRHLHGGALRRDARRPGRPGLAGVVVELLRRRRPVLAPGRLGPGAAQHLRLAGLPARGDDAAGAAPPGG